MCSLSDVPAPTELSPLSLHDALPICALLGLQHPPPGPGAGDRSDGGAPGMKESRESTGIGSLASQSVVYGFGGVLARMRSEEHTSELQSHVNLVCRLLLEKKKKKNRA